jgi:hypothetical protein
LSGARKGPRWIHTRQSGWLRARSLNLFKAKRPQITDSIRPTSARPYHRRALNYIPPPPLPSETRLARLTTWLALTVTWFAAHVLALFAPHQATSQLKKYARWSAIVLIVCAMKRMRFPRPAHRNHRPGARKRDLSMRRLGGAELRQALRAGTPAARARAIYAILTNPERCLARLVRRMQRRFTKLRVLPRPYADAAPVREAMSLAMCGAPHIHDSS